jgi:hypothetical protein
MNSLEGEIVDISSKSRSPTLEEKVNVEHY